MLSWRPWRGSTFDKKSDMKAAVLYNKGGAPQYVDIPEPVPQNEGEVLVSVKAVALKHVDKSRAKGTHYSTVKEGRSSSKQRTQEGQSRRCPRNG